MDDLPQPLIEKEHPSVLGWVRNPALDQGAAHCWMKPDGSMILLREDVVFICLAVGLVAQQP